MDLQALSTISECKETTQITLIFLVTQVKKNRQTSLITSGVRMEHNKQITSSFIVQDAKRDRQALCVTSGRKKIHEAAQTIL